ncbi:hypothetical protein LSCM4_06645 [Leishmania orientalis]|uniref:Uncharacterized protein n=1 Tax=Leishmania orientalis TaxID=2249476 RepID=A0A836HGD4_9TRYP|nr:hypothetical protein LSCM4_06645 [Leishmania orientalis]
MKGYGPNSSATENGVEHLYAHIKWFHAVNTPAELQEAVQAIDQLFCDELGGVTRGSDAEIQPARRASTSVRCGGSGGSAGDHSSGVVAAGYSNAPAHPVIGIQADIQWHTALETAIMCNDALSLATSDMRAVSGNGEDERSAQSTRSISAAAENSTFSLEDFLCTLAEAAKGWRQRATLAASTCTPVDVSPLRVIVKLNFKALPAAQLLLQRAEERTWTGLEGLCWQPLSDGGTADVMPTFARQEWLPAALSHTTDAAATPSEVKRQRLTPAAPRPSAAVVIELWWSADVVAQCGVTPGPLSFAAAPASVVQALMARTAHVLGSRIPLGFSLGWVLSPHPVPAEVLRSANVTAPLSIAAPTKTAMRQPRYVFYNLLEDAPAMISFLDGFWDELQSCKQDQPSSDTAVEPSGGTSLPGTVGRGEMKESSVEQAVVRASPPAPPSRLVRLITFPMLFESVFADVYTAKERHQAFESPPSLPVAAAAALTAAEESRRVAVAVLAYTTKLFSASHEATNANAKAPMNRAAGNAAETEPLEESLKHAAAPTAMTTPSHELRVFPTFWKNTRPPSRASLKSDEDGVYQSNVDKAARVFFPCCSIDG